MTFLGRAYYNLLGFDLIDNTDVKPKEWQEIDYRSYKISELFEGLNNLGLKIDPDSYLQYSESCDSPEDLVELVLEGEANDEYIEKVYLIVFELWRRLCKDKQSLSIFCDELDFKFQRFEEGEEVSESLQMMLGELEDILDQSVDEGEDPKDTFRLVSAYLAHNLEDFIYAFSSHQIDEGNDLFASEIVDGFYEYIDHRVWFDFLRIRLVALADPKEAGVMLQYLLEYLHEAPDLDLLFEVLRFLTYTEEVPLFYHVFELAIHLIEFESEFQDLLEISMNYLNSLDCEMEEDMIKAILSKRENYPEDQIVKIDDEDLQKVKEVVSSVPS